MRGKFPSPAPRLHLETHGSRRLNAAAFLASSSRSASLRISAPPHVRFSHLRTFVLFVMFTQHRPQAEATTGPFYLTPPRNP